MEKYLVEILEYGGSIILFEKIDGQYRQCQTNLNSPQYPIDKEIINMLRDAVRPGTPFLTGGARTSYTVSDELGDILKTMGKILDVTPTFRGKLLFVDQVQFFTHMMAQDYKSLQDKLNVFLLSRKIEGMNPSATL